MNYLEALAKAWRGVPGAAEQARFSPALREELERERQAEIANGYRLWIEPLPGVRETVFERENGRRLVRYSGPVLYAFEKEGKFYAFPDDAPFVDRSQAVDSGDFDFLVDASGEVVGRSDTLTGNRYGELNPPRAGAFGKTLTIILMVVLAVLVIRALILGPY